jgi:hypothetical protein
MHGNCNGELRERGCRDRENKRGSKSEGANDSFSNHRSPLSYLPAIYAWRGWEHCSRACPIWNPRTHQKFPSGGLSKAASLQSHGKNAPLQYFLRSCTLARPSVVVSEIAAQSSSGDKATFAEIAHDKALYRYSRMTTWTDLPICRSKRKHPASHKSLFTWQFED